MLNQSLSVCLIVKNEEKNLLRCLNSIKSIADEIIVVDTGSTDGTKEIAKKFGANVIDYIWKNDFGDARNRSIELATKDWILFLDADEEIAKEEAKQLKLMINEENNNLRFEGYYLRLVNIIDGVNVGDSIVFRVFRNRKEYRFEGKMHEQIINSVERFKGSNAIGSTAIKILHYGYDPKLFNQIEKSKRNIALLLSYNDNNKDGYYYYSLGNEYNRINKFEEALDCYNKAIEYKKDKLGVSMPIYYAYLIVAFVRILHAQRKFKEELKYIEFFKKTCSDFKDIYFQEALIYIERGKFTLAKKSLLEHIKYSNNTVNYSYPNNNFEQYNIPDLIEQLNLASIKHSNNLLTSIIVSTELNSKINECIKSLNEVSTEVLVLVDRKINFNYDEIENLGAIILKVNILDIDKELIRVIKRAKGNFSLILQEGEVLSAIDQKEIINLLENSKKNLIEINIINSQGIFENKDIRIIKNIKKIKEYDSFELLKRNEDIQESILNIYTLYKKEKIMIEKNTNSFQGIKILVATKLSEKLENLNEILNSFRKVNEEIMSIDYYFITDKNSNEILNFIDDIAEYSDNVKLKEGRQELKIENEMILEYGKDNKYDYLIILDEKSIIEISIITKVIQLDKDIITNKEYNDLSENRLIAFNYNSLNSEISFKNLNLLGENNGVLNLFLRAEALNLEIFIEKNI